MFMNKRRLSAEAFKAMAADGRLDALTEAVQEFMDAGDFSEKGYRHSKIPAVLNDNHNLSVSMVPWSSIGGDDDYYQIAIFAPTLTKNNPVIANYKRKFLANIDHDALKSIKKGKPLLGSVDLVNARVDGIFSEINCRLCISISMFGSKIWTARELAEAITHEVGHILSYFAAIADVVSYNYLISASVDRILGIEDKVKRVQLIEEVGELIGVEFQSSDVIADASSKNTLYKVLVTETAKARRSETGSVTYANHSWERLSDMIVTRMGGGAALATALVKKDKELPAILRSSDYTPNTFHYITQSVKVIGIILGSSLAPSVFVPVMAVLASLYGNLNDETFQDHDSPERRLKAIERGIIDRLKVKNISREEQEGIQEDLSVVRGLLENIKEKPDVTTIMGRIMSGKYLGKSKEDTQLRDYMEELEELSANELFVVKSVLEG